jgi:4-amino-4-deoxy-L-arabinose transferase-like glycosyltransferase
MATILAPRAPVNEPPALHQPPPSPAGPAPIDPSPSEGDGGRQARWVLPALVALLAATAVAYLWDLSASGYANSFYAAAVQAGTKSWKAFFFGSLDSSNFITVDKSPASLWVMELSGRIFGFNSWSLLVPQALEGVAAVGLVYAAVKRWFGPAAGLVAGGVLAGTPVAALMFRFDNPDALMVLLLVAAAYAMVRALEKAGTKWIVAAGVFLGFAFLAKMLQAFTVLPAFAAVYLLAAPTRLRRRLWQLAVGAVAVVVSAGWWVATVALWPAGSRPMVDGSPDNSILNLIFGYNGFGRIVSGGGAGGGGGAGFSGATGLFRLFNDLMGGQASWLLPAALLALVASVVWRGRAPRTDRTRAALLLWGGWLVVTGAVFSFGQGVIHTYYTVALAPAIGALVGIGGVLLWRHRDRLAARLLGAAAVATTAVWAYALLDRTPDYAPWVRILVLVAGALGTVALLTFPYAGAARQRLAVIAFAFAAITGLAGPIAYTLTTVTTAHTGSVPSAGPAVTDTTLGGPGGGGGPGGAGGPGGGFPGGGTSPGGGGSTSGSTGGFPGAPGRGSSAGGGFPSGMAGEGEAGTGRGGFPGGGERPGDGSAAGDAGGPDGATTTAALTKALQSGASHYRWTVATFGSQSAATLELASGEPVMAIGGFNGQGGNVSLATFEAYVAKGDIHYFIASGAGVGGSGGPGGPGGAGGPGGVRNSNSAITAWVEAHFTAKTIGGQTVYDLTSPKQYVSP